MDNKICKIHNQPGSFHELDVQQIEHISCKFCIQQKLQTEKINDVEQKQVLEQIYNRTIIQLNDFTQKLGKYTQSIQQISQEISKQVKKSLTFINKEKKQVEQKQYSTTLLLDEQKNKITSWLKQTKQQFLYQLEQLNIRTKLEELYESFSSFSIDDDQTQVQLKKIKQNDKIVDYQMLQKSSYKQQEKCYAIAFNQDSTIMFAGCDKLIKVFDFKDDQLKEVQKLNEHQDKVLCIEFMRKSNQFISASCDTTMLIWEQNESNQWQLNYIFKAHNSFIRCVLVNQNNDMLISGSGDKTIKFWQKQNNVWDWCQSINCQNQVYSICLNDQEDKLIASVSDNHLILVIQKQEKEWIIKQKISVEEDGFRLCFINSDQFVFQPRFRQHLLIFEYDFKDLNFKKGNELSYSNSAPDSNCLFPIRYISEIGLIIVKNDYHVHLIMINQNGQLTVQQSINFGTADLFGGISKDGRYIATWDNQSKEIQIRKSGY